MMKRIKVSLIPEMRTESDQVSQSPPFKHFKPTALLILCGLIFFCLFLYSRETFVEDLPVELGQEVPLPRTKRSASATPVRRFVNKNNVYSDSASRKLPSAIIIGVKKGGTRALLTFLRLHPDIRSVGPETHFFDKYYHRGIEWYRKQMPPTVEGQITMEKTPSYFITKEVPKRIHKMAPQMRLIVVVRDPVTRAVSDYTQTVSKKRKFVIRPFEDLAFKNHSSSGREGRRLVDTSWSAIKIGLYCKHLARWLRYFPLAQMHFVNGENLIINPAAELKKVQSFLDLQSIISERHFYFNSTKGFPCLKKARPGGRPRCLGKTKGRVHPNIDPDILQTLRKFYEPFNAKFFNMTGIDFGWNS